MEAALNYFFNERVNGAVVERLGGGDVSVVGDS